MFLNKIVEVLDGGRYYVENVYVKTGLFIIFVVGRPHPTPSTHPEITAVPGPYLEVSIFYQKQVVTTNATK